MAGRKKPTPPADAWEMWGDDARYERNRITGDFRLNTSPWAQELARLDAQSRRESAGLRRAPITKPLEHAMSVSSNAASEASKKGLSGKAKRQYVGGAINRARHEKAHEKADHREAMADARSQIRYHEAQIAGLREGIKQRRDLAGATPSHHGKVKPQGSRIKLTPIRTIQGYQLDATRRLNPYDIRENFGASQTPAALSNQTANNLGEAVDVVQERTGRRYTGSRRSRQGMYDWILDNMDAPPTPRAAPVTRPLAQPKPKRAPRPKKPPDYEQMRQRQIAAAGGLVPKTPLDRLRKMPVREMSDPQLLRDWENHPPERRRGVLEREMARRHAKAEKAQQPKPAKRTQRRRS